MTSNTCNDSNQLPLSFTKCPVCNETFVSPKVLPCCFRTFCQACLEKLQDMPDRIKCPACGQEVTLPANGVLGLYTDYSIVNMMEQIASAVSSNSANTFSCTGCKSKELAAVARCYDCANLLCPNCVMAHQFMHCFEGHRVANLKELNDKDLTFELRPIPCCKHPDEIIKTYCRTCDTLICKECIIYEHPKGLHEHEFLSEVTPKLVRITFIYSHYCLLCV